MQIEIDFEVYKALTVLRESEGDSYNAVLRRVLKLPNQNALLTASMGGPDGKVFEFASGNLPRNALAAAAEGGHWDRNRNALNPAGAWFDNIFFPDGTRFRANYKGKTFEAEIQGGRWIGTDGIARTSPSAAAGAISNTTVNGWRFWFVRRPHDEDWQRMDALKP